MIEYDAKHFGDIIRYKGSVFPAALAGAIPAVLLTLICRAAFHYGGLQEYMEVFPEPSKGVQMAWAMVTTVSGFLIAFRAQLAYSRYWEGVTLVEQVRGSWLNAVSNLFAFSTQDAKRFHDVRKFQQLLVRLMSLLFATSLEEISMNPYSPSREHELSGIDGESMEYLRQQYAKRDVVLAWIQRLIIDNHNNGVIAVAPPILTRVFQELSNGIVSVNDARKFTTIPFPYPFAQVIMLLLTLFCYILLPLGAVTWLEPGLDVLCVFLISFSYFSLHLIALEIELPFGEDANDLPLEEMQMEMNVRLAVLLDPLTQTTPKMPHFKHAERSNGDLSPTGKALSIASMDRASSAPDIDRSSSNGDLALSPKWVTKGIFKTSTLRKSTAPSRTKTENERKKTFLMEQQHHVCVKLEEASTEDYVELQWEPLEAQAQPTSSSSKALLRITEKSGLNVQNGATSSHSTTRLSLSAGSVNEMELVADNGRPPSPLPPSTTGQPRPQQKRTVSFETLGLPLPQRNSGHSFMLSSLGGESSSVTSRHLSSEEDGSGDSTCSMNTDHWPESHV